MPWNITTALFLASHTQSFLTQNHHSRRPSTLNMFTTSLQHTDQAWRAPIALTLPTHPPRAPRLSPAQTQDPMSAPDPSAPVPLAPPRLQQGWSPAPHRPALPSHGPCPARPTHGPEVHLVIEQPHPQRGSWCPELGLPHGGLTLGWGGGMESGYSSGQTHSNNAFIPPASPLSERHKVKDIRRLFPHVVSKPFFTAEMEK